MRWRIHYPDRVVEGSTRAEWEAAPDEGVQVVVVLEPYPDHPDGEPHRPVAGVDDRQVWTGVDPYDPASESARREAPSLPSDWPVKYGSLLPDADYFRIWEEAAHGD